MTEALYVVKDKMDMFEREQLDKKKIETFEITKQKMLAIKQSIETCLLNEPHLIGCIPGIEEQEALAFDCWLGKYKHIIKDDSAIKNELSTFIEQVNILRMDAVDWKNFLSRWKLRRIFHNDDFLVIWRETKNDLNINEQFDRQSVHNDKEEKSDDATDDHN